jgi:hypothetical protein
MKMPKPKKRSPKAIIERGNPKTEQAYIKFPREELIKISKKKDESNQEVKIYPSVINKLIKDNYYKKPFDIHTHNHLKDYGCSALPSKNDLINFHNDIALSKSKGKIIAQRDSETGELQGYTVFLKQREDNYGNSINYKIKSKLFGKEYGVDDFKKDFQFQLNKYEQSRKKSPKKRGACLREFCKIEGMSLRFVPAKGYFFNVQTGNFEKRDNALEQKVLTSIFGIFVLSGLFFSLFNFTGAVIGFSKSFSFPLGVFLFILGVLGLFFGKKL